MLTHGDQAVARFLPSSTVSSWSIDPDGRGRLPRVRLKRQVIGWGTAGILSLVVCASIWLEDALSSKLLAHMKDARGRLEGVTMLRRDVRKTQLALIENAVLTAHHRGNGGSVADERLASALARANEVLSRPARSDAESDAMNRLARAMQEWRQHARAALDFEDAAIGLPRLREMHEEVDAAAEALVELSSTEGENIDDQLMALQRRERMVHVGSFLVMAVTAAVALRSWRRSVHAEAQFRSSEQARAALKAMSASVAHEVNNQLGVLQNSIGLLRKNRADEGLLKFQEESVEQIQRLTRDLNNFSVRTPRPPEMVDVLKLAKSTAQHFSPHVQVHGDQPVWLFADAASLGRALLNVIKNAVEAGAPVELFVEEDTAEVRIRCIDRGPGVDANHRDRLGEPFFTTKAQGTGLGLTLVQSVVAEHGGRFSLLSREDQGAEATLRFPRTRGGTRLPAAADRRQTG